MIREVGAEVVGEVRNRDRLRRCRPYWDERHRERVAVGERRARDVAKALRKVRVRDAVAAEHAVHAHAVVEVVTRLGARDEVRVRVRVEPADLEHARTREALPVEAELVEEVGELVAD